MKKKNKTIKAYEKVLRNDKDWDYTFLLELELKKLKRMYKYFSESAFSQTNKQTAWEISLCIRLLEIYRQDDPVTRTYFENLNKNRKTKIVPLPNGTKKLEIEKVTYTKYPVYVNPRNEYRFMDRRYAGLNEAIADSKADPDNVRLKDGVELLKSEVRRYKAFYLYNYIRTFKMPLWFE